MGTNQRFRRKLVRQAIAISLGIAALAAIVLYADSVNVPPTHMRAWFEHADGGSSGTLWLEKAITAGERSKGLMFRKSMDDSEGMIFIYPNEMVQSFWMKNTFIPLDMIFIDRNFKVVGVIAEVPPMTTEFRKVDKPSKYVVELVAGKAAREGIKVGSTLKFRGDMPQAKD
ncbi:MAG: DUF192 domain-containing protein [Deltaproteobacteria bacterium]|nr:DUF192 domain-containing protein [Deltaproteobacteria bacterium]